VALLADSILSDVQSVKVVQWRCHEHAVGAAQWRGLLRGAS
jgi:hypothetical protein